jgi:hypothetical protein
LDANYSDHGPTHASALGEAVIRIWSDLPQQEVQDRLFKEAVASQGEAIRSQLAVFLHDQHERTSDTVDDERGMSQEKLAAAFGLTEVRKGHESNGFEPIGARG